MLSRKTIVYTILMLVLVMVVAEPSGLASCTSCSDAWLFSGSPWTIVVLLGSLLIGLLLQPLFLLFSTTAGSVAFFCVLAVCQWSRWKGRREHRISSRNAMEGR